MKHKDKLDIWHDFKNSDILGTWHNSSKHFLDEATTNRLSCPGMSGISLNNTMHYSFEASFVVACLKSLMSLSSRHSILLRTKLKKEYSSKLLLSKQVGRRNIVHLHLPSSWSSEEIMGTDKTNNCWIPEHQGEKLSIKCSSWCVQAR